jgi:hypothetical protein
VIGRRWLFGDGVANLTYNGIGDTLTVTHAVGALTISYNVDGRMNTVLTGVNRPDYLRHLTPSGCLRRLGVVEMQAALALDSEET